MLTIVDMLRARLRSNFLIGGLLRARQSHTHKSYLLRNCLSSRLLYQTWLGTARRMALAARKVTMKHIIMFYGIYCAYFSIVGFNTDNLQEKIYHQEKQDMGRRRYLDSQSRICLVTRSLRKESGSKHVQ